MIKMFFTMWSKKLSVILKCKTDISFSHIDKGREAGRSLYTLDNIKIDSYRKIDSYSTEIHDFQMMTVYRWRHKCTCSVGWVLKYTCFFFSQALLNVSIWTPLYLSPYCSHVLWCLWLSMWCWIQTWALGSAA